MESEMLRNPQINRRNRSTLDPSNRPSGTFAIATSTVATNKWAIAFNVPVIVKALPTDWKVNGASPTSVTVVDSQHITLTFAVNVAAGQTYVIPAGSANVRTSNGGMVAAASGTF
jgi:hypothetical protein